MVQIGGGKINNHPCTQAESDRNWQILSQIIEQGAFDAFTVRVSTDDTDTSGKFLYPAMTTAATRNANADPLIAVEIANPAGAETLTLFLDADGGNLAASYNASGNYSLNLVDGVIGWYDTTNYGGSGSDDKTVKVSAADTTSEYLYASMKDTGTYDSGTDILVLAQIEDASANEKLRLFIRIDATFYTNLLTTDFYDAFFDSGGNLNLDGLTYNDSTHTLSATGGGSGETIIVLIEEDITGVTEDETSEITPGAGEVTEDPEDTAVASLPLIEYTRTVLNLKYYVPTQSGDPGHGSNKMRLATVEEVDGATTYIRYDHITCYYDDGADFEVGNYKKTDWDDFPENKDIDDLASEFPSFSIVRRWRGIVINDVLVTSLCKVVPPPPLPEGFTNES